MPGLGVGGNASDMNRQWSEPTPESAPVVSRCKEVFSSLASTRGIVLAVDFHTHPYKWNFFACGSFEPDDPAGCPQRQLPFLLARWAPRTTAELRARSVGDQGGAGKGKGKEKEEKGARMDQEEIGCDAFSFDECCFHRKHELRSTLQRTLHREYGLQHAYTLEASFAGCRRETQTQVEARAWAQSQSQRPTGRAEAGGKAAADHSDSGGRAREGFHFSPVQLEAMGRALLLVYLRYCTVSDSELQPLLAELVSDQYRAVGVGVNSNSLGDTFVQRLAARQQQQQHHHQQQQQQQKGGGAAKTKGRRGNGAGASGNKQSSKADKSFSRRPRTKRAAAKQRVMQFPAQAAAAAAELVS